MPLQIKNYVSFDIDDVWDWYPNSSIDDIFYDLNLTIGEECDEGGHDFLVYIANEVARFNLQKEKSSLLTNKVIFLDNYSWPNVLRELEKIVRKCDTGEWEDSLKRLREHFEWEYESHSFID